LSNSKRLEERGIRPADRWNEEYVRREGEHLYVTVLSNTVIEFR
jgi:hypothetical protein